MSKPLEPRALANWIRGNKGNFVPCQGLRPTSENAPCQGLRPTSENAAEAAASIKLKERPG